MSHTALDWIALGVLLGMGTFLIYLLIFIHDIPYQVAKQRGHPQQDAIWVGCWLSLATLHLMWPLLFIWAVSKRGPLVPGADAGRVAELEKTVAELRAQLGAKEAA